MSRFRAQFQSDANFRFRTGLGGLMLASVLMFCPIFWGRVPFPADVVVNFPPFDAHSRACCVGMRHAEQGDLVTQVYPWHWALGQSLRQGVIPIWNPQMLMGTPFLAEPVYSVFFPLNWLYAIVNPGVALAILAMVRMGILAVTMAMFVRQLGASNAGAQLAGLTLALSGWFTAWAGWCHVDSAMWLPLLCMCIDKLIAAISPRAIALTGTTLALVVLAGHPEVAFQVILTACTYAAYRLFPLKRESGYFLAAFAGASILGILMAAVQLIPTLEWLTNITRSLQPWAAFPLHNILGLVSRDLSANPNADHVPIPEGAAYIGALAFAALPFAWLWSKKRDVIFFAALVVVSAGIVYGLQPFYWLSLHVPVLSGLPNTRLIVVVDFGLAVLMGLGLSALQARSREAQSSGLGLFLALPAIAIPLGLLVVRVAGHVAIPLRYNLPLFAAAFLLTMVAFTRRISSNVLAFCAAFLLMVDLGVFAFAHTPFVPIADIFPPSATFTFLESKADASWRAAPVDLTYGANFGMPYGLSSPDGYDFPLRRTAKLLSVFGIRGPGLGFDSKNLLGSHRGLLDLTSARYLVATDWNQGKQNLTSQPDRFHPVFHDRHVWIFEYPSALPLAFVAPESHAKVVPDETAERAEVLGADFDPRQTVILPATVSRYSGVVSPPQPDSARIVGSDANEFDIEASARTNSLLVLNEASYPGWSAWVDGQPAQVVRTNYAFLSVPMATGTHRVKIKMVSGSFRLGAALSAAGLLIMALLVGVQLFHNTAHKNLGVAK
jgi:hypothetical protein